MERLISIFIIAVLIFSCGYKPVNFEKSSLKVCIQKVNINSPEPTLSDNLYKALSDLIIAKGDEIDCSIKRQTDLYVNINNISFFPIGYSVAQRANVYKISISIGIILETKEGNQILNKTITETTQYIGAGLRADFERRYAIEELSKQLQVRIFTLLNEL